MILFIKTQTFIYLNAYLFEITYIVSKVNTIIDQKCTIIPQIGG